MTPDIPLSEFVFYMLSQPLSLWSPIVDEFYDYGKFTSIIMHRWEHYQVEMFMVLPGTELGELHTHPNVESYEMHISGLINFTINDVTTENYTETLPLGARKIVHVPTDAVHGAYPMTPGAFMSFQKWLVGKPTSVGNDWCDQSEIKRDVEMDIKNRGIK